jgi:hypothetical protein
VTKLEMSFKSFQDGEDFVMQEGKIFFKTDCSSWAKVVKNGLSFDDHLDSFYLPQQNTFIPITTQKKEERKIEYEDDESKYRILFKNGEIVREPIIEKNEEYDNTKVIEKMLDQLFSESEQLIRDYISRNEFRSVSRIQSIIRNYNSINMFIDDKLPRKLKFHNIVSSNWTFIPIKSK